MHDLVHILSLSPRSCTCLAVHHPNIPRVRPRPNGAPRAPNGLPPSRSVQTARMRPACRRRPATQSPTSIRRSTHAATHTHTRAHTHMPADRRAPYLRGTRLHMLADVLGNVRVTGRRRVVICTAILVRRLRGCVPIPRWARAGSRSGQQGMDGEWQWTAGGGRSRLERDSVMCSEARHEPDAKLRPDRLHPATNVE